MLDASLSKIQHIITGEMQVKDLLVKNYDVSVYNVYLDYCGKRANDQNTSFYLSVNEKERMQMHS